MNILSFRLFLSYFSFIKQLKNPFCQVFCPEILPTVFVRVHFDDCFLKYGINMILAKQTCERNLFPFWPYGVQSCEQCCQIVDGFMARVPPIQKFLLKLSLSKNLILSFLCFFFASILKTC